VNLIEEEVDVEIHIGALEDSALVAIHMGDLFSATCASPAYLERKGCPMRPEELALHDGVNWTPANDIPWPYRLGGEESAGLPNMRVWVNSAASALAATAHGLGITRVLEFMVEDYLRSGTLVQIFTHYAEQSWPVHLLYVRQGLVPLKVRAFLDWMTPRLRQRLNHRPIDVI
jgi:DNA-binding transcriptional LysR family regulator